MDAGVAITAWTIRLAMLGYFAALLLMLLQRPQPARWLWTLGCGIFLLHVAAAFHFYHDWSHADAVAETARQTHELLGVVFGAGVWFNYLFALVWVTDVAWWWISPTARRRRPRWVAALIHGYMLLIAFNGVVVFESGPVRWWGVIASAILLVAAGWSLRRAPRTP